ncbi:MAG: hypothetical protein ACKVQU_25580 [Burkholderiales bacterium]
MTHPFVALMRRYVVDYLVCQNPAVCKDIMEPDYVLHMGGTDLGPRDEAYVPAVMRQLEQFPGLCMTVHEIILSDKERLAMRFSQHGASARHDGRTAAWAGIGLYKWNGVRLTSNFALEDYYSRRVQLSRGIPNAVESPAVAPWDTNPEAGNGNAEEAVRKWLLAGAARDIDRIAFDDEPAGSSTPLVEIEHTVIDDLFSAGDRIAFHATQTGRFIGRLDVAPDAIGRAGTLFSAGIVSVDAAGRISGRVIRERAGLARSVRR